MPTHDEYQEICAVASIGQASPEEIARLAEHLLECNACRRAYSEFTSMAAQQYAYDSARGTSQEEERQFLDPDLLRRRFLLRAAEKGIHSDGRDRIVPEIPEYSSFWQKATRSPVVTGFAFAAILGCMLYGYALSTRLVRPSLTAATAHAPSDRPMAGAEILAGAGPDLKARDADLEAQIAKLRDDQNKIRRQDAILRESLSLTSESNEKLLGERVKLEESRRILEGKLAEAEGLLQAARSEEAKLRQEATKLRNEAGDAQTTYVADQIRMRELSEELAEKNTALARNEQLLGRDRDVRDMMTARNLHIFDVSDTDPKGKTKPAFGRIFYTEGKSLVFYAYDLNEAKLQNANYHYRVWGSQEARKEKVTSLGVFYSDDKTQRRWVFKCDDPKVLRQIDSVFVTLEPAGAEYPKGDRMLDAYMGGVANHP